MAEYINKAEAIKILCKGCNGCNPLDYPASFCINREEMVELPTIDIVYCSECKWRSGNEHYAICTHLGREIDTLDWFCADGERKEK